MNTELSKEIVNILKVGDIAPDFKLLDQNGIEHTLSQYIKLVGKSAIKWLSLAVSFINMYYQHHL